LTKCLSQTLKENNITNGVCLQLVLKMFGWEEVSNLREKIDFFSLPGNPFIDLRKEVNTNIRDFDWNSVTEKLSHVEEPFAKLEQDDLLSIVIYTGQKVYKPLNKALWDANESEYGCWKKFTYHLLKGLCSLPYYWSKTPLWHGRKRIDNDEELYVPGKLVVWPGFSSTSWNKKTAFPPESPTMEWIYFEIYSVQGRHISTVSLEPHEDEVLPAYSAFVVLSKSKANNIEYSCSRGPILVWGKSLFMG